MSYLEPIEQLPIEKNKINFIASDLRRLVIKAYKKKEKFDVDKILDILIRKVGSYGTLILPTYSWDFCVDRKYDILNTKSKTGILSQTALERYEFNRTKHPIYSFAVYGKEKDTFTILENGHSFGLNTPFDYFHKKNVKTIIIDVSYQRSFTFVHHVEKKEKVSYRYLKSFIGEYIDEYGTSSNRLYYMYVRNLDMGVVTNINPIGKLMEEKGISKNYFIDDINIKEIDLKTAYDLIQRDIRENNSNNLFYISK